MEVNSFVSWELAGTVAGAATMVWILLSLIKGLFGSMWTKQFSTVFATVGSMALMEYMVYAGTAATVDNYILAVFNGAVVAMAVLQFEVVTQSKVSEKISAAVRGE